MSDFVESAKSSMNAAVSRISWEAQKQLRVRSKQTEIENLISQRRQLVDDLARVAITLYQQGKLSDQQLSRLCASVIELDQDVKNRDSQLQDIKNEAYPVNQFAPGPTLNYNPPPPPPPPHMPGAGNQTRTSAPPPSSHTSGPGTQTQTCPVCGNPVRSNSLYCRACGAKLR